ncbi:CLAVATA3/ESR (CLE)-related protein 25-like [Punica granatum]|uniref:Uncharacterized protein n=2 Tax=Punica granatum TaxID=22663 RepID=A0A218WT98_PUNGR|nr:CLAVATA3/ESR (CLE)-related protein 25-like [Punica granatum]OWM76005.1 hypothetical protein CDL15_Pgr009650 [Punica granatum]PKI56190.1 hypothetical protein CRG98_023385 [Punica granatum]
MGRRNCRPLSANALFGAGMVAGVIWLLLLGAVAVDAADGGREKSSVNPVVLKNVQFSEGKVSAKVVPRPESDVNYMSKRRVPNGPDPIHNRRAGNSKQPPGRA